MRYLIAIFILLCAKIGFSQTQQNVGVQLTLPSVSLLSLSDNSNFGLNFQSPSVAGAPLGTSTTNNSKWLNFTSAVPPNVTRHISAQIVSGSVPNGVRIKLQTSTVAGGAGSRGTPVATVYLSGTPQNIVNNIGGAYTGVGTSNGYNLTFSLEIQDYSQLRSSSNTVTITYTIADN